MQIHIHTPSPCSQAVGALVKASYREGCFPTRDGRTHTWLLDCRLGLSQSDILKQIIPLLSAGFASEDVHQAVGFGVGASFLVGGLVFYEEHNFRGGILRDRPKKYGTAKMLEGALCSDRRVAIVDDILNSGQTARHVVSRLKTLGFEEIIFFSILRFAWGNGAARLKQDGVQVYSLAEVTMLDRSNLHVTTPASRRSRIYHRIRQWLNSEQHLE